MWHFFVFLLLLILVPILNCAMLALRCLDNHKAVFDSLLQNADVIMVGYKFPLVHYIY